MCNLGTMYETGRDVRTNDSNAVNWFRKAAEMGDATAQAALGCLIEAGRGVPRDDVEALTWYRKAAAQRDGRGLFNLARFYEEGRGGLPVDLIEARRYYGRSAAKGNGPAARRLREKPALPSLKDVAAADQLRKRRAEGDPLGPGAAPPACTSDEVKAADSGAESWSVAEVGHMLKYLDLEKYAPAFGREAVDGRMFVQLTDKQLRDLGVSASMHRKKILTAVAALKKPANDVTRRA